MPCWRQQGRLRQAMHADTVALWQRQGGFRRLHVSLPASCLPPASSRHRLQVKSYFTALVNLRNSITGVLYREDPTIFRWGVRERAGRQAGRGKGAAACGCQRLSVLPVAGTQCYLWLAGPGMPANPSSPPPQASCPTLHSPAHMPPRSWNLINEPRCKYCGPEAVDSWVGEMAAHLKVRCRPPAVLLRPHIDALLCIWNVAACSTCTCARAAHAALRCPALPRLQSVDPNHLVTTGAEGFIAEGDPSGMASE
jgi:hypothetical protein